MQVLSAQLMGSCLAPHICAAVRVAEGPRAPVQALTWAETRQPVVLHGPQPHRHKPDLGPPLVNLPGLLHSFVPWPFLSLAFYEMDPCTAGAALQELYCPWSWHHSALPGTVWHRG